MTNRRTLLIAVGANALATPLLSVAQQPAAGKMARVGFLHPGAAAGATLNLEALRQGMRELGYVEGKTYQLEQRWADGKLERLPALAIELVQLKVDVMVAATGPATQAAREATRTIPIVMPVASDPVADGFVNSLARPGGNITGLSMMAPELGAKRMQLLKEMVPTLSRPLAVLWNPGFAEMRARFADAQRSAPLAGMSVTSVEARNLEELNVAFETITRLGADGMLLLVDPFTSSQTKQIVEFAAARRLPVIYEVSVFVNAGGLMSYGPNLADQYRRAATFVSKILKGAKPADLPVEQPTKFELFINGKTAKSLGLTIPQSLLISAEKVIE